MQFKRYDFVATPAKHLVAFEIDLAQFFGCDKEKLLNNHLPTFFPYNPSFVWKVKCDDNVAIAYCLAEYRTTDTALKVNRTLSYIYENWANICHDCDIYFEKYTKGVFDIKAVYQGLTYYLSVSLQELKQIMGNRNSPKLVKIRLADDCRIDALSFNKWQLECFCHEIYSIVKNHIKKGKSYAYVESTKS